MWCSNVWSTLTWTFGHIFTGLQLLIQFCRLYDWFTLKKFLVFNLWIESLNSIAIILAHYECGRVYGWISNGILNWYGKSQTSSLFFFQPCFWIETERKSNKQMVGVATLLTTDKLYNLWNSFCSRTCAVCYSPDKDSTTTNAIILYCWFVQKFVLQYI